MLIDYNADSDKESETTIQAMEAKIQIPDSDRVISIWNAYDVYNAYDASRCGGTLWQGLLNLLQLSTSIRQRMS